MLGSAAHSSADSFPSCVLNTASISPLNLSSVLAKNERIDYIKEQAFKSFRLKTEKWNRFLLTEENQKILLDFLDKGQSPQLVFFTGPGGNLYVGSGKVLLVILSNQNSYRDWPRAVLEDVRKHVEMLRNTAYILQGHISRRTYLPLPELMDHIHDEEAICKAQRFTK